MHVVYVCMHACMYVCMYVCGCGMQFRCLKVGNNNNDVMWISYQQGLIPVALIAFMRYLSWTMVLLHCCIKGVLVILEGKLRDVVVTPCLGDSWWTMVWKVKLFTCLLDVLSLFLFLLLSPFSTSFPIFPPPSSPLPITYHTAPFPLHLLPPLFHSPLAHTFISTRTHTVSHTTDTHTPTNTQTHTH